MAASLLIKYRMICDIVSKLSGIVLYLVTLCLANVSGNDTMSSILL